jgi:hypothetical protein
MIYENCPDFKLGICTAYKDKTCKYAYHKACNANYLCRDDNCKYGHGISIMKRTIISDMYDTIVNNDYNEKNDTYCSKINCISDECVKHHYFSYDNRSFIYKIVNQNVSDEQAWNEYQQKYTIVSPALSSALSLNDTIPSSSPCPIATTPPILTTYASLFKNQITEITEITEIDEIDEITETMLNIRKELSHNTKRKDTIKEQIKQLEDELIIVENIITNNKTQLKELAVKIADC